jgi:hypothetical protein
MGDEDRSLQEVSQSGLLGSRVCRLKSCLAAATKPSPLMAIMAMRWGRRFYPLPALVPFLTLLMVALVGVARPPLAAILVLPRTKVAPTSSSPEACRVAKSSSSFVVSGYSRLSSRTEVQHIVTSRTSR